MNRTPPTRWIFVSILVAATSGCASTEPQRSFSWSVWDPFHIAPAFGWGMEPIRIGVVPETDEVLDMRTWWDLRERTPWTELQSALAQKLRRPVQIEQHDLSQVAAHLEYGNLDFALLTDQQCDELMKGEKTCVVIARSKTLKRKGIIVAAASSDIKTIGDIAGKRFAFGPPGDPVLHYAALAALHAAGVPTNKIRREIIPYDSLQYHMNSREVAKEIVYGTSHVGVIDREMYNQLPDTGGGWIPLRFSKDQFRVLGEASPVQPGPVVASTKSDPKLVQSVTSFLLNVEEQSPQVATSLGVAGFTGVDPANTSDSAEPASASPTP